MTDIYEDDVQTALEQHFQKTIEEVENTSVDDAKKSFAGNEVTMVVNPHLSDELYDILVNSEVVFCDTQSYNIVLYDTSIIANTLVHSFDGGGVDYEVAKEIAEEVLLLNKAYSFILIDY